MNAPRPERDSRDARITELEREINRLKRENNRLERENNRLERETDHLKQQLESVRRAGRRQAAPFAKDRPQGDGKRPGGRSGAKYGRQGCRSRPARVDETHAAPVPAACPDCSGAVEVTRVASQYQEDLPEVRPLAHQFDVEVGHCSQCRRPVQGRHALQTSDALGAAAAQPGPGIVALVVELHTEMGVSLAKVADLLRRHFNLQVTPGGLAHLLHGTVRDAGPGYAELCEQVRNSPVVTPDETGWRVGALRHWLWAFVTTDTTVYAICPGRGFADAVTVLGTDYADVFVCDGWAPYRCFRDAQHQSCLSHLLPRCEELREDHPDSSWAGEVQATLQAGLDLRDRCIAGELSEHGMATARGRLIARLGRQVDAPPPLKDAVCFANHLLTEFSAVFLFLWDPSLDATNWRAEQAIRPAVVIRKVCGGNLTRKGADTQQVLLSVVRTARQRALDLASLVGTMLRTAEPAVPAALVAGRTPAGAAVEEMSALDPVVPEVHGLPPPAALSPTPSQRRMPPYDRRETRSVAPTHRAACCDTGCASWLSNLRSVGPEQVGLDRHYCHGSRRARAFRFPTAASQRRGVSVNKHRANATSSPLRTLKRQAHCGPVSVGNLRAKRYAPGTRCEGTPWHQPVMPVKSRPAALLCNLSTRFGGI